MLYLPLLNHLVSNFLRNVKIVLVFSSSGPKQVYLHITVGRIFFILTTTAYSKSRCIVTTYSSLNSLMQGVGIFLRAI